MTPRRHLRRRLVLLATIAGLAVVVAIAWAGDRRDSGAAPDAVSVRQVDGAIGMSNSRSGSALLTASDMVPGETVAGSVLMGNSGDIPMKLHLEGEIAEPGELADALRLKVTRGDSAALYRGPLSGLDSAMGVIQPDDESRYRLQVTLPESVGNALQGRSTSVDLLWKGEGAAPPPACRITAMRARFFVFRSRHRMRMVLRYRATKAATVRLRFYERMPFDRRGEFVGAVTTRVDPAEGEWRLDRFARRRAETELDDLRDEGRGFIVRLYVAGAPDYCARRMNLLLTDLRRVDRQYVWFQRGTFRRIP